MFFDLNVKGSSLENNIKLANLASQYGWHHINFSYNQNDFQNALTLKTDLRDSLENIIDFDYTLEIKSTNIIEIRKVSNKFRNHKFSKKSCSYFMMEEPWCSSSF